MNRYSFLSFLILTKRKLHIDLDYEFLCLGLSCHHRDYRLAWNLNEALCIKLEKKEPILIEDSFLKDKVSYSKFYFHDKANLTEYSLLGNRNEWGFLIPEESMMDYFLLINSERINIDLIEKKLKDIDIVLSFGRMNINQLKNKERLLM